MRLPWILFLSLTVVLVLAAPGGSNLDSVGATGEPAVDAAATMTHTVFIPGAGCDSCDAQPVRLYYVGWRQETAPLSSGSVRRAMWATTSPREIAESGHFPDANVSMALSVITPDHQASYSGSASTGNPQFCDDILHSAGYPTKLDARRIIYLVDMVDNDPFAIELARVLDKQWLECEMGLIPVLHPPDEFARMLAAGESRIFLTSIDATTSQPFDLLHRLYDSDSPENFTDVEPDDPALSVQPHLADARATTNEAEAEAKYHAISRHVLGWPSNAYLNILPLLWRYDFGPYNPPRLTLDPPIGVLVSPFDRTATVSGAATPGVPGESIAGITVDWADGTKEAVSLPASHWYEPSPNSQSAFIIVSARQSDGTKTWRAKHVFVNPSVPFGGAIIIR